MNIDTKSVGFRLVMRLLIGAPFFGFGFYLLWRAGLQGGLFEAFGVALVGMAAMIAGAIIVAGPLAEIVGGCVGTLFWSNEKASPMPVYSISEAHLKREQYKEAMDGFERIAEEFPEEFRPYQAMIDIALVHLKDRERAKSVYQRGLESLKKPEERELLTRIYTATLARENGEA